MNEDEQVKIPKYNLTAPIKRCIECGKELTGLYICNIHKPGYAKCLLHGLGVEKVRNQP